MLEVTVQSFVHKLEEGGWVRLIRIALLVAAIVFACYRFMYTDGGFRGLSHPESIEQAQIARELARGNGFSTKVIRPLAMWQFQKNKGEWPVAKTPDTYHAPLPPLVNSLLLRLAKKHWEMTTKDIVYVCDRIIAAGQIGFFLLGVLVNFFIARRLFDERLAVLGVGLILLCDTFWQFSLTGLPQMLMFALFSLCIYALLRAMEARSAESSRGVVLWVGAAGLLFGALTLAHGLTVSIFAGALVFTAVYFKPRIISTLVMGAAFALVVSPWLARNYRVCGSPFGIAPYALLDQVKGSETELMRTPFIDTKGITFDGVRAKMQAQIYEQLANIYQLLGRILVAPVFFVALLHLFKRRETSAFRWCVLLMWIGALLGIAAIGLREGTNGLRPNDLHILFIPLLTFYGLAFVLVLWSRLEINVALLRTAFIGFILLVSGFPFLVTVLGEQYGRVQWPPYVPPFIAILKEWTEPEEIIASDIPWGVAWYADRRSLWVPTTVKDFTEMNDFGRLGGKLVGLYLTPVSGNQPFISGIVKGEYKDWAAFILRNVSLRDFMLKAVVPLPIDNECVFYADRDRWSEKVD